MDDYNVLVLMEKDSKTGFFIRTVDSYTILLGIDYVQKIFMTKEAGGNDKVYLYLSTKWDVEDWEYEAMFDYYDTDMYSDLGVLAEDKDDDFNPVWLFKFDFINDRLDMDAKLNEITKRHRAQMERIIRDIQESKEEYLSEEF